MKESKSSTDLLQLQVVENGKNKNKNKMKTIKEENKGRRRSP
jgi:hypothetical protein